MKYDRMKTIIKMLICLLSFNCVAQIAPLEDHIYMVFGEISDKRE